MLPAGAGRFGPHQVATDQGETLPAGRRSGESRAMPTTRLADVRFAPAGRTRSGNEPWRVRFAPAGPKRSLRVLSFSKDRRLGPRQVQGAIDRAAGPPRTDQTPAPPAQQSRGTGVGVR